MAAHSGHFPEVKNLALSSEILQLRTFLLGIHPLNEDSLDAFSSGWSELTVKRKTILTAMGESERYLYFVLNGVQRAYYLGDQSREATIVFTYPSSFSGIADSLLTGLPSHYYFETLTASRFLRIPGTELFRLMDQYPDVRVLVMKALALALHGVLRRQAEIQVFSSEEKMRTLISRSPQLFQLVPHKYIASYLGIDATNFSKILSKI